MFATLKPSSLITAGITSALLLIPNIAVATAQLSAIVEHSDPSNTQVSPFELLASGTIVHLGANETLILGYLSSCRQEQITGGTVSIGNSQSSVTNGTVEVELVPCSGVEYNIADQQSLSAGATIFRNLPDPTTIPKQTIHSTQPIIMAPQKQGTMILEPDNLALAVLEFETYNGYVDLAAHDQSLKAGETYFITLGKNWVIFTVAEDANDQTQSIISRLVMM
jgi:hypothetical protein